MGGVVVVVVVVAVVLVFVVDFVFAEGNTTDPAEVQSVWEEAKPPDLRGAAGASETLS